MGRPTVPDSGEVLTQQHDRICRKPSTSRAQSKTGMVAYLGGVTVHIFRVYTVLILLHFTNIVTERTKIRL